MMQDGERAFDLLRNPLDKACLEALVLSISLKKAKPEMHSAVAVTVGVADGGPATDETSDSPNDSPAMPAAATPASPIATAHPLVPPPKPSRPSVGSGASLSPVLGNAGAISMAMLATLEAENKELRLTVGKLHEENSCLRTTTAEKESMLLMRDRMIEELMADKWRVCQLFFKSLLNSWGPTMLIFFS
jgi:hypothetical protein